MEKEYTFTKAFSMSEQEVITLKESELEESHKNLLLSEFINQYNKLPEEVRGRFNDNLRETLNCNNEG